MKKLCKNESGFSVIEVLIVIVIIALIGIAGWLVYKHEHKVPVTTNSSVSTATNKSSPQNTNYFTISQWNIRAPYSGSLTLQYQPVAGNPNLMNVSSTQLNAGGPSICTTADGAVGNIGKYLPTDDIPTEGPPAETAQQYVETYPSEAYYAKVGNYYYIYFGGQLNSCNNLTLQTQTLDAFESIVPKLTAY
ncbi:MAG TPA: prepilin-type N-terminal cleavage/methylation domain-containing protein [Candidatus Saccharimonadales bacterium]|jgi:prepilin-type N-terminal cleavage/methylation domain-containing protein|nr:prepilin-type N-terminal cleavage/methylation domain-containing protein [Candidatus Saccharimonadales bacterium]